MSLTAQLRAARALIDWTQADLAAAAGVSTVSVKNIEKGTTEPRVGTLRSMIRALEEAGVVFLPENGGGAGVRLFKEHLVGWKQAATPFPGDYRGIQEPFERAFLAAGGPADAALFARTSADMKSEIFLVSPAAATFIRTMAGDWTDAVNPSLFGWSLLVGSGNPYERLGVRPPRLSQ